MDCPNHKEYPECPYLLKDMSNSTGSIDGGMKRICLSSPCNWKIEKQNEKILKLLKNPSEDPWSKFGVED